MNKNYLKLFLTAVIFLPLLQIGLDNLFDLSSWVNFLLAFTTGCCIILSGCAVIDPEGVFITNESVPGGVLNRLRRLVIILAAVAIFPWGGFKKLYNGSVDLSYQYTQKCSERPMFYDAMWKTFRDKKEIQGLNVETFTKIANILMEPRKDGQAVTWKWVHENTQIPFEQFVNLYTDLSSYIESKRQDYLNLEIKCQQLAAQHNIFIKQFPNNLYNVFIGRPKINYEYGFTSDKTNQVFRDKVE